MTRTLPPVALASLAAATQAAVVRGRRPTPLSLLGAGLLAAPSIYLLTGSVRRFRRLGTTVDPRGGAAPSALVTTGPNAWSRNPMYAGMVGLLLAHSAVRRSAPAVIPAALFGLWIDLTQIASEEQQLAARFGPQFDAYRRRVRRWL